MRLLRQLEFAVAGIDEPGPAINDRGYNNKQCNIDVEKKARELLRSNGAGQIAKEIRVEWNARLKTCAGRADYRKKLISLNPLLKDHGDEINPTLRHELAHLLAQWRAGRRRIAPHGAEWRQACCDLRIADEAR